MQAWSGWLLGMLTALKALLADQERSSRLTARRLMSKSECAVCLAESVQQGRLVTHIASFQHHALYVRVWTTTHIMT